jgi:DNA-directed RNA polymerase II subunit RPB1
MNIFLCQNIASQIELEEIADAKRQIISPNDSKTTFGMKEDGLFGSYNMTNANIIIDWKSAMNIIANTQLDNYRQIKKEDYKGYELFSEIIPSKINMNKSLKIKNGKIYEGQISKDFLGPKKESGIHKLIWDEYGVEQTRTFLDNSQKITNSFNQWRGFTVGAGDLELSNHVETQIKNEFLNKDTKTIQMITELENNPELLTEELFEKNIFAEYNTVRDDISKLIMNNLSPNNNFNIMIKSGSKGDATNMGQINGCLGMQAFEGGMQPKKINNRTLPYFFQNDDRSESRGLVKNSCYTGMNYVELYYHTGAARQGLIDAAVRTADSGYAQRKLIKILEDSMIQYDGTVRGANSNIIQFIYGDSGYDSTKQYEYNFVMLEKNNKEIKEKYTVSDNKENKDYFEKIIGMRDFMRKNQHKFKMDYKVLTTNYKFCVNIIRIIDSARYNEDLSKNNEELTFKYILEQLDEIANKTILMNKKQNNIIKSKDEELSKTLFVIMLHDSLAPARCIKEYKLNKAQFDAIIEQVIINYNKNIAEAGEMVGIISGQSLGEPLTQMTLKSFHSSGIAAISNTTQGMPRLKELYSLTKKMKTPQMILYLTPEYAISREMANKVASYVKYTTLDDIRKSINVYFDPNPNDKDSFTVLDNAKNIYQSSNINRNSCQTDIYGLPWLMRIEIDIEKMLEKEVTLLDIKSKFCNAWQKRYSDTKTIKKEEKYVFDRITQIAVISNSDNDESPVIHIRFDMTEYDIQIIYNFIDHIVIPFKLKGIPNVNNAGAVKEIRKIFNDETGDVNNIEEHNIYTDGTNLTDIRYINGIDIYRTICNDPNEILSIFGIEAARAVLMKEIIYTYERAGQPIGFQHLTLLVDKMTNGGYLMSIDRVGMGKSDVEPLSKASFEQQVETLISAAVFGEVDHMKGVSSRISAGLVVKCGTGLCDLVLDTEMIEKSEYTVDIGQKYLKTYESIESNNINEYITKEVETDVFIPE